MNSGKFPSEPCSVCGKQKYSPITRGFPPTPSTRQAQKFSSRLNISEVATARIDSFSYPTACTGSSRTNSEAWTSARVVDLAPPRVPILAELKQPFSARNFLRHVPDEACGAQGALPGHLLFVRGPASFGFAQDKTGRLRQWRVMNGEKLQAEERFLDGAGRRVRKSERGREKPACSARNDKFCVGALEARQARTTMAR